MPVVKKEKEIEKTGQNIVFVDTNVITDPNSVDELRKGGNLLCISLTTIKELDKIKVYPEISFGVRETIRKIDALLAANDPSLMIVKNMNFTGFDFDKNHPDHKIIASLNWVLFHFKKKHKPFVGYDKIKMISNDNVVRILARTIDEKNELIVEPYLKIRLEIKQKDLSTKSVLVRADDVDTIRGVKRCYEFPAKGTLKRIPNGESVIVRSDFNPQSGQTTDKIIERFAAIRVGDKFSIIDSEINASGIRAMHNGHKNWEQVIAINYLLDPDIDLVILQGGAGTGKTLLALAAGMHLKQAGKYSRIVISRPTIPLDKQQQLGFLPGGLDEKMVNWLGPIFENLFLILYNNKKDKKEEAGNVEDERYIESIETLSKHFIRYEALDYIRGKGFRRVVYIIDEAQNLTQHQIKTILTRAGKGAKFILTGDLSQIDNEDLDRNTSGLAYAIKRMRGMEHVAVVNLKETLRSRLASIAEKVL